MQHQLSVYTIVTVVLCICDMLLCACVHTMTLMQPADTVAAFKSHLKTHFYRRLFLTDRPHFSSHELFVLFPSLRVLSFTCICIVFIMIYNTYYKYNMHYILQIFFSTSCSYPWCCLCFENFLTLESNLCLLL